MPPIGRANDDDSMDMVENVDDRIIARLHGLQYDADVLRKLEEICQNRLQTGIMFDIIDADLQLFLRFVLSWNTLLYSNFVVL
jgi:hypothetical protein